MDTPPISALLDFALDAAWQAGRITLWYFQNGVTAERKSDNSPVTIADKTAEKRLRELIQKYWPDHAIQVRRVLSRFCQIKPHFFFYF